MSSADISQPKQTFFWVSMTRAASEVLFLQEPTGLKTIATYDEADDEPSTEVDVIRERIEHDDSVLLHNITLDAFDVYEQASKSISGLTFDDMGVECIIAATLRLHSNNKLIKQ
ncbi:hypothetical protein [Photobacterium lutimaris]|uniref:Uncharacterized protein n=1 Tax=Photobacterium lutimaris TaxID=388278 RepID=A0A2T3ITH7_9GAMM|nr:hypothetical protein [Photobacterium lutimaris]PSU31669.1 hypothetical protein C9I99_21005 [Photobacterium lutimaris]TDR72695.1 hypothetical protein DFP78_113171 [Photobacterium lutimaris]